MYHSVNRDTYFNKYIVLKHPLSVKVGDGRTLQATKIGDIKAIFLMYGNKSQITLTNVFYVENEESNLISYTKVTDTNKIVSAGNIMKIFNKQRKLIALGTRENNLIKMRSLIKRKDNRVNPNPTRKNDSGATQKKK